MREVLTSDFETANIQYVKFWVMDPFVDNPDATGGDLYINLGNISEDILRDSRKSFENGLPGSADVKNVDTTAWGRVPTVQAVVHAFDNANESRQYQDVGFDGIMDQDEESFFSNYLQKALLITTPDAYQKILNDPSGDDFHYFEVLIMMHSNWEFSTGIKNITDRKATRRHPRCRKSLIPQRAQHFRIWKI